MDLSLSPEEQQFRDEVRAALDREVTQEVVEEVHGRKQLCGPNMRILMKKIGARGWLTPTWPKKYGGLEGTNMQRLIVYEELGLRGAQSVFCGASMVGPTLMLFGTEEQKETYLRPIARGEIDFALGYTEPEAGSDMANLRIKAVDKGDHFVISGQKMFNTLCHCDEYHWLGARTSTEGPKHKGISLFIVDLKSPGITIRPLWTMDGERTNEVFYDDVIVPKKNLVGQVNRGFYHILAAVDFERLFAIGEIQRTFNELVKFVKTERRNGRPLREDPVVRQKIAQLTIEMEIIRLFSYRCAWMLDKNIIPTAEAAMLKLFMFELLQRITQTGLQVVRLYGQLARRVPLCRFAGESANMYLHSLRRTISAGSSEIQRNVIAQRGLGLPR